ncbi:hypothetical protein [Ruixingdingia sedimenti]|uniref:Uncharacterized protein n=1 Tax=Ruixingdingia sedimenti TaxID=3073604 RepID=A0ABU1FDC3_9RHOB|nr:hypothetical protein [Xinfangfangia sp. LG-4]MDR5654885.1 hypothetical protein [Xinfangfangia sp. LG-4]
MQFERKIAGAALKDPTPPAVEPTGEQKGGSLEIKGGTVSPKVSPHKDWRHVIAHNFELRNNVRTLFYWDNTFTGESSYEVNLDFAYHLIRSGPTLEFTLKKPDGVPEDQGILFEDGAVGTRDRIRIADVQIYYPQATTLNFSSEFVFGTYGHKPRRWTLAELTALLPSSEEAPNPVITGLTLGGGAGMPDFVRGLEERSLQDVLAPHQTEGFDAETWEGPLTRAAGTTDYLRLMYNEQTGKCLVLALSIGVVGDADPNMVPVEPPTLPNEGSTDAPTPSNPWGGGSGGPRLPAATGDEYSYTDENGNPLAATPAPAGNGTVYALHPDGFSCSQDGGRSWDLRQLSNPGTLIDIAAGPGGVYLLTEDGDVWLGTGGPKGQFAKLPLTDVSAGAEAEVELVNGGFELGDLTGWTLVQGDEPQVVDTATPPQRDGKYYLTRDWRIISAQDFSIEQTVALPASVVGETGKLRLYADVLTENADIGKVEILDGTEVVVPADNFALTYSGGTFRANGFASSPTAGTLNLIGTPTGGSVGSWSVSDGYTGIQLNGNEGQNVNGSINWRVETSTGDLFDGFVALRIFDLDTSNGFVEGLEIQGVTSYDLLSSSVTAFDMGFEKFNFNGAPVNTAGDQPAGRFHVVVRSTFGFTYQGRWVAGLGMKGPGSAAVPPATVLATAQSDASAWRRVTAEYNGELPARVTVRVSGQAVGGYADVYVDNVALTLPGVSEELKAGAISHVRANSEGGGADLFIGDTVVSRRAGMSPDENAATHPGPGDGIALFATPGEALVSSGDGRQKTVASGTRLAIFAGQAWESHTLPDGQAACAVLNEPVWCIATPIGQLFRYEFVTAALQAPVVVGPDGHLAGDFKRRGAVLTSREGAIDFVGATGNASSWATQPVNASAPARQSCCLDSGRYLGHPKGAYSLFWSDNPVQPNSWQYAGRLERPILKIVEVR